MFDCLSYQVQAPWDRFRVVENLGEKTYARIWRGRAEPEETICRKTAHQREKSADFEFFFLFLVDFIYFYSRSPSSMGERNQKVSGGRRPLNRLG